jgi:predicted TIM-barrel fold metal-dependent hydrolase
MACVGQQTGEANMIAAPSRATQEIRDQIDHPIIDSDGHSLEFIPSVRDNLRSIAGQSMVDGFDAILDAPKSAGSLSADERRALGLFRLTWWGFPARNSLDRATAMLPRLQYERLPELGIDYALVYPTFGLMAPMFDQAEIRLALVRAYNIYYADLYGGLQDRLSHVALIPMHTPEEAIAELEYVVGQLGMKAVLLAGFVYRPLIGNDNPRAARWLDTFGTDSPYDYDPVWAKCLELGVSPTFHSSTMGWYRANSQTNYVYNHIGNFAAAGETTCRSLVMDGVPMRFPDLQFAFLEGGVGWGCNLYSDLLSHFEKRNRQAIQDLDPATLDRPRIRELFEQFARDAELKNIDELDDVLETLADPNEDPSKIDEFARSGIESEEDIKRVFTQQLHFGCEADDPINSLAFQTNLNPFDSKLSAIFGSDVGHWDVQDSRNVVREAWELVEKEMISEADFRAFVCDNPKRLWAGTNPEFFSGTAIDF